MTRPLRSLACALCVLAAARTTASAASAKPNLIFILSDDIKPCTEQD